MPSSLRRWLALFSAVVLALLGVGLAAGPAQAAPTTRFVATNGDDTDNDCTDSSDPCEHIQYAVDQANAGDTVSIAGGTYHESVRIRESLTLIGAGANGSGKSTIDGEFDEGPSIFVDGFDTNSPPEVTIKDLDVSGNSDNDGILVEFAVAHVIDCVVSSNDRDGIDIEDDSTVTVENSEVSNNGNNGITLDVNQRDLAAAAKRAAVLPQATVTASVINANQDGGVIVETGEADITDTTLDGNVGAGVVFDGFGTQGSLTTSTVSNTVPFSGEREGFGGGVLVFPGGTGTVDTSTLFGNTGQGVLALNANVTIDNSTISGTLQPAGEDGESGGIQELPYGGIAVDNAVPTIARAGNGAYDKAAARKQNAAAVPDAAEVIATGTIVADNTTLHDCNGDVTDGGYNLDSDGSCAWSATGSISKGNAELGPLGDNGGPTQTLYLAKTSDAIDQIPTGSANCSTSADDQRGTPRPQAKKCDIGAVEDDQPAIVFAPEKLPDGTVGKHYHAQITATGGLGAPYEFSLAPNSAPLPDGLTLHAGGAINGTPTESGRFPITVSVDDPTLHNYVIVIAAAPTTAPPSTTPPTVTPPTSGAIANTGAPVGSLSITGVLAIVAGLLVLVAAGWVGTRSGRHRPNRAH